MTASRADAAYLEKIARIHDCLVTKKGSDAVDLAEDLLRSNPDLPHAYFMLALYAFMQRDFGNAVELLVSAHERDPECREYADCLAVLYTVIGKLTDGLYYAKLATALDSDSTVLPFIPHQLSNYFEALDRIEPAQHFVNGMMLYNAGRYEDAARSCELELKQNERHHRCYDLLGQCHLKLGRYDRAVNAFHAAINIEPDYAQSYGFLGSALSHLGRFEEAFICHRNALERDAESIDRATAALFDAECLPDFSDSVRLELDAELTKRIAARSPVELDINRPGSWTSPAGGRRRTVSGSGISPTRSTIPRPPRSSWRC